MIALIFLAIWATLVRAQACDGDAQPLLWAVQRRDAPHAVALVVRAFAFCFFLFLFSKSSVFGGVAVACRCAAAGQSGAAAAAGD